MREVVLGCAEAGLFDVRWSDRILEEWARAARKIGPQGETLARGEIVGVAARFPDAVVRYPDDKLRQFWLPDADDIHVLMAAVVGSCDAIMTVNIKDFPKDVLAENDLDRLSPDVYLTGLYHENPDVVAGVGARVLDRARELSGDDWTMRALMKKARLPRFGKALG